MSRRSPLNSLKDFHSVAELVHYRIKASLIAPEYDSSLINSSKPMPYTTYRISIMSPEESFYLSKCTPCRSCIR